MSDRLYNPNSNTLLFIILFIFRNHLITLMASSTIFSSTYPVLSTPPQPQSDSSPIDSSPFAEADRTISELIQAMTNQTNALDTSESAAPPPIRKTGLVFRGKPLAMALYKPKRKRVARTPKPQSSGSRKPRNGLLPRDATGKFSNMKSTARAQPTEASSMDTTPTPATSEQVLQIVTEPISPAPPLETAHQTLSQVAVDAAPNQVVAPSTQPLVLDVNSPLIPSLTFPMPTAEELASFLYSTYIVPKLTENPSFFQCREQFYHKYYHAHLISFFQSNLGTTCISFSQVDTMIFAALRLLGFD